METFIFLIFTITAFVILTAFAINRVKDIQTEKLGKALADNLLVLKPENRYIISLPFEISDEDFDEIIKGIEGALDLENSNTHVIVVQGHVKMIEFS